jgi:sodium/proline symporter
VQDETLTALAFAAYLIVIAALGLVAYRRTRNAAGFILGNRQLSQWVTALSAGASDMSGWLLLGLPGLAYVSLFESIWVALGLFAGTYLNWRFIAQPLREKSERYGNALTIPEYFEKRFNDDTHVLRTLSALCILAFFVFYTAAGLVAGGKLFAASFGLPYSTAVILGASLIVAYTAFGGFLAAAWTDALQAVLMVFALATVAALAFWQMGELPAQARADDLKFLVPPKPVSAVVVLSSLAWGFGYFGQPHILNRFMAISDPRQLGTARKLALAWTGVCLGAAIVVGFCAPSVLQSPLVGGDTEKVFIHLIELLLHPAIAGVCLAAILAAIMSTADSQLLVASAALTHDLFGRSAETSGQGLHWHRAAVVLICLVATTLALEPGAMVFDLVAYAWAGFGAALGPCIIMSLYCATTSRWSVLAGMLVGAFVVVVWELLDGGIFEIYALLPGFGCGLAAIFLTDRVARGR